LVGRGALCSTENSAPGRRLPALDPAGCRHRLVAEATRQPLRPAQPRASRRAALLQFPFDLAVVSACDSGVGAWLSGEGILGLPFALYVAGNRSTLLALWPVYDDSSAEFMARFFARLKQGQPLGRALSATKKEFATGAAGEKLRAASFWAGYSLFGVPF
jgi:CHAT domain-containing protein